MDIYVNLRYADYKELEKQLRDLDSCETSHTSVDGYYHKSISFIVEGVRFEFHGPNVKAAEEMLPPAENGETRGDQVAREVLNFSDEVGETTYVPLPCCINCGRPHPEGSKCVFLFRACRL